MNQQAANPPFTSRVAQQLYESWFSPYSQERLSSSEWDRVEPDLTSTALGCVESLFTPNPRGLLLLGPIGTGKTSVLWLIRRELIIRTANRHPGPGSDFVESENFTWADNLIRQHWLTWAAGASWDTYREMVSTLRRYAKDNDDDGLARLYGRRVMFIDDLLRAEDEDAHWNASLMFELIDYRWRHKLPTFVTTNKTGTQLRSFSDDWSATIDRLADPSWTTTWTIGGKSKRI